jgi:deoxyribose-phosphate aldolase
MVRAVCPVWTLPEAAAKIPGMCPLTVADVTYERVAKTIDHSLLRPELTLNEVREGCELAARYDVASVCVRPLDVVLAVGLLHGSDVAVGTVVGFPHGSHKTATKVFEAQRALGDGATELDMVIDIGGLRSGEDGRVEADIKAVVEAAEGEAIVKVILENSYLTKDEIVRGCRLVESAGADFVKTSTGFAPSGATLEDLRLMRATVSPRVRVKAAGGVRTLDALLDVMDAGADRCGATRTAEMLDDYRARVDGRTAAVSPAGDPSGY